MSGTVATEKILRRSRIGGSEFETLAELSAELLRLDETKRDYVVDSRVMTFSTGEDDVIGGREAGSYLWFDNPDGEADGGLVLDFAHGQISDRLQIPKRYYDRMREVAPMLLDRNVNHWLHTKGDRRMVRMLDGKVRALLSDRYRRLDNIDLAGKALIPALADIPGLTFHAAAITPERLHVRAVLPTVATEIRVGETVWAGIEVRNSEVGEGALQVQPFAWKLDCLNGMLSQAGAMRQHHVGRKAEEDAYAIWQDDTIRADDNAFFLKVRDAIGAAVDETFFHEEVVQPMRDAATSTKILDMPKATEQLATRFDLDGDESAAVLRLLAEGGDLTQWGAANAITAAAKDAPTFRRQAELEQVGGQLVALDRREWTAIAG